MNEWEGLISDGGKNSIGIQLKDLPHFISRQKYRSLEPIQTTPNPRKWREENDQRIAALEKAASEAEAQWREKAKEDLGKDKKAYETSVSDRLKRNKYGV